MTLVALCCEPVLAIVGLDRPYMLKDYESMSSITFSISPFLESIQEWSIANWHDAVLHENGQCVAGLSLESI